MTIHIDYDREENKIESILESQGNVIRTLMYCININWLRKQIENVATYVQVLRQEKNILSKPCFYLVGNIKVSHTIVVQVR